MINFDFISHHVSYSVPTFPIWYSSLQIKYLESSILSYYISYSLARHLLGASPNLVKPLSFAWTLVGPCSLWACISFSFSPPPYIYIYIYCFCFCFFPYVIWCIISILNLLILFIISENFVIKVFKSLKVLLGLKFYYQKS
jgi:hypothetical protein